MFNIAKMIVLLMVATIIATADQAHEISGYDCRLPSKISTYDWSSICPEPEARKGKVKHKDVKPSPWTIIQYDDKLEVDGYQCKQTETTFRIYCGAYSHNKLADVPQIETRIVMDPDTCRDIIRDRQFSVGGKTVPILFNRENIIDDIPIGDIRVSGTNIECQGEKTQTLDGKIVDKLVVLRQTKVFVRKDVITFFGGANATSMNAHEILPESCTLEQRGCTAFSGTYIWDPPANRCPYKNVQTIIGVMKFGVLLSIKKAIRLQLTNQTRVIRGDCPLMTLHGTRYPHFFVVHSAHPAVEELDSGDLDIAAFIEERDDYLVYLMEQKQRWSRGPSEKKLFCQQHINKISDEVPFRFSIGQDNALFAHHQGDLLVVYRCVPRIGVAIDNLADCYLEAPVIINGEVLFYEPMTKRFLQSGTVVECPAKVSRARGFRTTKNHHITFLPGITVYPKAGIKHFKGVVEKAVKSHTDMIHSGLYSQDNLDGWGFHMKTVDYSRSLHNHNTHTKINTCLKKDSCEQDILTLNGVTNTITNLYESVKAFDFWEFLEDKTWKIMNTYAVICYCLGHLITILYYLSKCICKKKGLTKTIKQGKAFFKRNNEDSEVYDESQL